MTTTKNIIVSETEIGKRLDFFLSHRELGLSRNRVQDLIEESKIRVNGKPEKSKYKVKSGDIIEIEIPPPKEISILPENIPLKVLFEDEHLIVIDKPAGMVTHPGAGNYSGTLVNALLYHCKNLSGINGYLRPGIVHRLDKDTSGVMVAAKDDITHSGLVEQWQKGAVLKKYAALVKGVIQQNVFSIDAPISRHKKQRKKMTVNLTGGKKALSRLKVIERFKNATLIEIEIKTGRTHQIRVHLSYLKHPVIGDTQYGKKSEIISRQALHAATLGFTHPVSDKYMEFSSEIPEDMKYAIDSIKNTSKGK